MKHLVAILAFTMLAMCGIQAQNGNGNNNANGAGNNAWGSGQLLVTWLQNGGQIPQPLAVHIIHEVREWGQQNFGLSQGQMIQRYNQGLLTIEFVATNPPSLTFRVRFGGLEIVIIEVIS